MKRNVNDHDTKLDKANFMSEYEVTIGFDQTVCEDCRGIIIDVMHDSYPIDRWDEIDNNYDSIKFSKAHQGQSIKLLVESGERGCHLCKLILTRLRNDLKHHSSLESSHHIFVRTRAATKFQLFLCTGDVSRFIRDVWEWQKAQALKIFQIHDREGDYIIDPHTEGATRFLARDGKIKLDRLPDRTVGSDHCFEVVSKWLRECVERHSSCKREEFFLPKRLVDLNSFEDNGMVHLRLTSRTDRWIYATVSYSWGDNTYLRLKTKNHDPNRPDLTERSHCAGIALDRFPVTVQDEIRIARRLGFRYLWIDSVCIVQDSPMDKDWIEQSKEMTQIYAGGSLNISATSGENSQSGMLRPTERRGVQIGSMCVQKSGHGLCTLQKAQHQQLVVGEPLGILSLEDTPLAERGWVFQERLVSVATIHYTHQGLVWECAQGLKLDHDQGTNRPDWKRQWRAMIQSQAVLPFLGQGQSAEDQTREMVLQRWNEWVAAYAARNLYDFKDRLPAVAGMAVALKRQFRMTYAAGLWNENLISGLMWKRFNRTDRLKRFDGDKTPSWSWASVQGQLEYVSRTITTSLKAPNVRMIGSVEVEEEVFGSCGRVKGGRIRVRGVLQKVVLDKRIRPAMRQREYEEIGVESGFKNPINVQVMLDNPYSFSADRIPCWCLRLASFEDHGREGDLFLILEQLEGQTDHFKRLGFAETEPWANSLSVTGSSGQFLQGKSCELTLV